VTQIGEGIAVTMVRLEEHKCVFCGKAEHDNKKKDEIKPSGWKRKSNFEGVGGNFSEQKKALYPKNQSPPNSTYRSEGHHCLAFSAFIVDASTNPKDRFAALNHYLKEDGYDPNNENNCIDLPGRKVQGDDDAHAQFKEFEKAVMAGKPLQLHIGGHGKEFMMQSYLLVRDIVNSAKRRNLCEKPDDEFKSKLKEKVTQKEDIAFKKTASKAPGWVAHPGPLAEAERYVMKNNSLSEIKYPNL
jgi:hypothetical protein